MSSIISKISGRSPKSLRSSRSSTPPSSSSSAISDHERLPQWRIIQNNIDNIFYRLKSIDGPLDYSYSGLIDYITDSSIIPIDSARDKGKFTAVMGSRRDSVRSHYNTFRKIIQELKRESNNFKLYFTDGHVYVYESLIREYPELQVFNLSVNEAFSKTELSKFYVETSHFADLRSLSHMRREIKQTGLKNQDKNPIELVAKLLGLVSSA